ncbi:unnamed protein product, partial [Amoebophrya sp. A25]
HDFVLHQHDLVVLLKIHIIYSITKMGNASYSAGASSIDEVCAFAESLGVLCSRQVGLGEEAVWVPIVCSTEISLLDLFECLRDQDLERLRTHGNNLEHFCRHLVTALGALVDGVDTTTSTSTNKTNKSSSIKNIYKEFQAGWRLKRRGGATAGSPGPSNKAVVVGAASRGAPKPEELKRDVLDAHLTSAQSLVAARILTRVLPFVLQKATEQDNGPPCEQTLLWGAAAIVSPTPSPEAGGTSAEEILPTSTSPSRRRSNPGLQIVTALSSSSVDGGGESCRLGSTKEDAGGTTSAADTALENAGNPNYPAGVHLAGTPSKMNRAAVSALGWELLQILSRLLFLEDFTVRAPDGSQPLRRNPKLTPSERERLRTSGSSSLAGTPRAARTNEEAGNTGKVDDDNSFSCLNSSKSIRAYSGAQALG